VTFCYREGDGGASSLGREPFFIQFANQLFRKLPLGAAEAAFRNLVSLSIDLQDDGTAMFLAVLVTSGCSKFPDLAAKLLLNPTLAMLDDDIKSRKNDDVKSSRLSWLATRLTMLKAAIDGAWFTCLMPRPAQTPGPLKTCAPYLTPGCTLAGLHSAGEMQQHVDVVVKTLLDVSNITSPTVPDGVCDVMSTLLSNLCSPFIPLDSIPHASLPGSLGLGVATWVAMDGSGAPAPKWHVPTSEDHATAQRVAKLLLDESMSDIQDMAGSGKMAAQGPKERWRLYRFANCLPRFLPDDISQQKQNFACNSTIFGGY
jgi:hypothetical protein